MQRCEAYIDLRLIRKNALFIKKRANGALFYAVVKADGYGHGGVEVARAVEDVADGFCVALTDEGAQLRIAGIKKPILVLTPPMGGDDIARAKHYGLSITVNGEKTARLSRGLNCHIKINTGMNRYGCAVEELSNVLKELDSQRVEGVYSHLYAPADEEARLAQLALFERAEKLVKNFAPHAVAHIAASGGLLVGGRFIKDAVRCGILLYGYAPAGFRARVYPAMKVAAKKVQTSPAVGGGAGYGRAERQFERLSAYRAGYADGFFRGVPLGVGKLCMDGFISEDESGKKVIFCNAEEYARQCGTISYEVLTSVARRAEKIYLS